MHSSSIHEFSLDLLYYSVCHCNSSLHSVYICVGAFSCTCVCLCVTDAGFQPFRSRRRLNSKQIMGLDDGEDIYRAMQQVADPLSFQVHTCVHSLCLCGPAE